MGVRQTPRVLRTSVGAVVVAALAVTLLGTAPASAVSRTDTVPVPAPAPAPVVPTTYVTVTLTPKSGSLVGVAYPITASFSAPVTRPAVAEQNMKVYIGNALAAGAWSWKDSRTAIFRPKTLFWPGHSRVYVRMTLQGVQIGASRGVKYVGKSGTTRLYVLKIARAIVSYVDGKTHRMTVYIDGKLKRTFKVSLGKPGFETRSGIKAVIEKFPVRHMTSRAAGITDPHDQYDLMAPYAVRITPTGEFVHGAPWAAGRIGVRNGSHGCTNLFTADAKWFYTAALVGDPVITRRTPRAMEPWNGLGAAWNIPWKTWLAHSALKGQTA